MSTSNTFFVLVVPDEAAPSVRQFATAVEVAEFIKGLLADPASCRSRVYPFFGHRVNISRGDRKFLLPPGEEPIPLFDQAAPVEVDEDGDLSPAEVDQDREYRELTSRLRDEEAARPEPSAPPVKVPSSALPAPAVQDSVLPEADDLADDEPL